MNLELILKSFAANPLLYVGLSGGTAMVCYLGAQLIAIASRQRFEKQANALQLAALKKQIEILEQKAKAAPAAGWNGYRKFTVAQKKFECSDTYSFYLKPHDGKTPLPPFKPGQFITFQFKLADKPEPYVRCYSLSDGYIHDDHYRVTIKRAMPYENPGDWDFDTKKIGRISSHFCDEVMEGDILDVKAPAGGFYLNMEVDRPVVLLGGGIGITPMIAMARALTHAGDKRDIFLFFGCRNSSDHMMRDEMLELQKKNPNFRLHICYSKPSDKDVQGVDYQHHSRVSPELLKEILPSSNYEFFLCGPGPFMQTLVNGLQEWGVPKDRLKYEEFGPSTFKDPAAGGSSGGTAATAGCSVTFAKSDKKAAWDGNSTLWQLAKANGITIPKDCGAGNCGSCKVAIRQGEVEHTKHIGCDLEEGSCLTCICKPKGDLVLDF